MNKVLILGILCSFLILAACVQKEATSQQSIQDIIGKQPAVNVTKVENQTKPETQAKPPVNITNFVTNETPNLYKKCRYSAILYGGCKWTDEKKIAFLSNLVLNL